MLFRRRDVQDDADGLATAGVYLTTDGMVSTSRREQSPGEREQSPGSYRLIGP
jgi:hypothetical protein